MTTQNEIIEKLDLTADQTVKVKEAYEAVLVSDGEKDVELYDGTITPNLNKRLAGMVQAVKSVNGKDGEIVLSREDLDIPTDEQLARQEKEDRFVKTWSGRDQREVNKENPSPFDFKARGNGIDNDTQAFIDLESIYVDYEIDLFNKTYLVDKEFIKNKYKNGFFKIANVVHNSELEADNLTRKKYCTNLVTMNNGTEIFTGSGATFQSICIIKKPEWVNPHVFMTQRSARTDGNTASGNWLKYETYRIVEYDFTEDGLDVLPLSFSEPLDIGHASYLSHTVDENGDIYFYSGFPSDSTTNANRSNKGFSRIKWRGSSTSNADVELYQLHAFSEAEGDYSYLHRGSVAVSRSGKYLYICSDNQITKQYTSQIYSLPDLLSSSNTMLVKPISSYNWDVKDKVTQGTIITDEYIISYYDDKDHSCTLEVKNFSGSVISEVKEFDTYKSFYSKAELLGKDGVFTTLEGEGLCLYGNDLYVGYRDYIKKPLDTSYVKYNDRYFVPIGTSTNQSPEFYPKLWQEVSSEFVGVVSDWDSSVTYNTSGFTNVSYNKRVFKISALDGLDIQATKGKQHAKTLSSSVAIDLQSGYTLQTYNRFTTSINTRLTFDPDLTTLFSTTAKVLNLRGNGTGIHFSVMRNTVESLSVYSSTVNTVMTAQNSKNLFIGATNGVSGGIDESLIGSGLWFSSSNTAPSVRPDKTNYQTLGTASYVFKDIYSANALIVSSDERLKQQFRSLSERERDAAIEIKNSICLYKFNDAVEIKGDGARWHCGVKAQEVVAILQKHGLNPFDYAFVCYDTWDTQEEVKDECGAVVQTALEAGDKYAVRYDELSMFLFASL